MEQLYKVTWMSEDGMQSDGNKTYAMACQRACEIMAETGTPDVMVDVDIDFSDLSTKDTDQHMHYPGSPFDDDI